MLQLVQEVRNVTQEVSALENVKFILPVEFEFEDFSIRNLKMLKAINKDYFEIIVISMYPDLMVQEAIQASSGITRNTGSLMYGYLYPIIAA